MAGHPFLPLFVGDFLASTATWSGEERALYLLLLSYQWASGPLPANPDRLAGVCQYDRARFLDLWQIVGTKFQPTPAGLLNQRLEEHRSRSAEISAARQEKAKRAAAARWSEHAPSIPLPNAPSNAPSNAKSMPSTPLHTTPIHSRGSDHVRDIPDGLVLNGSPDMSTSRDVEPPEFQQLREIYPRRAGSQPWKRAFAAAQARLRDGASWAELLAGVERYAAFVRAAGNEGTTYTMMAATFLGPERHYLEPWTAPLTKAEVRQDKNADAVTEWLDQPTGGGLMP